MKQVFKKECQNCAFTVEYVKRKFCACEAATDFARDVTDLDFPCAHYWPAALIVTTSIDPPQHPYCRCALKPVFIDD